MKTTPKSAYAQHRDNSKRRGIVFTLTFEQWWEYWEPHFHNRGCRKGQVGMLRTRDEGGYTPGNVRIGTQKENAAENGVTKRVKRACAAYRQSTKRKTFGAEDWMHCQGKMDAYTEDEETS